MAKNEQNGGFHGDESHEIESIKKHKKQIKTKDQIRSVPWRNLWPVSQGDDKNLVYPGIVDQSLQGGSLLVINGVKIPVNGLINEQLEL